MGLARVALCCAITLVACDDAQESVDAAPITAEDVGFEPDLPVEPSCDDGEFNGEEEGVDCGGDCDPCPVCEEDADCADRCVDGQCVDPTCEDARHNGAETDVDCGGDCDPCERGQACVEDAHCGLAPIRRTRWLCCDRQMVTA